MQFKNQFITLHSAVLPTNTLLVTKFTGEERLSGLFRFDLELLFRNTGDMTGFQDANGELDLEMVLYAPVRLALQVRVPAGSVGTATTNREIVGYFAELEQQEEGPGWIKFRAVLVPKLWRLTRTHRSRIVLDKDVEELLESVLTDDLFEPKVEFEFKLSRQGNDARGPERDVYPQREYTVQYEESDWAFLSRWLEHEGIFFYFENCEQGDETVDKVIFADSASAYGTSSFAATFPYSPRSGGKGADPDQFAKEEIFSFHCRQTRLPTQVVLSDYNWRTPSAELRCSADLRDDGTGHHYEYNNHYKTKAQGDALAVVRAEEIACRSRLFHGESSCRTFRPGFQFTLDGHFRKEFNDSFVLISVKHEAEQMINLEAATVTGSKYSNTFTAIRSDVAFRPERTTPWPAIHGVMNAKIDAEGEGDYAELDEHGRYKVVFPFDEHAPDAEPGHASRWVRMAQPYAGKRTGMHFPLLKGTEVLVVHVDGDPDRPIIAGAVPNTETESPVTGANATRNSLRTASGNLLQLDDDHNVSGFFMSDARGSRVMDHRWRTGGSAYDAGSIGQSPGGGRGDALGDGAVPKVGEVPVEPGNASQLAASPGPGAGMPEIVSTIWEQNADSGDNIPAWKTFFGIGGSNSAFDSIATKGRYIDQQSSPKPLGLSAAAGLAGPLLTDTTLTEGNIVTMLNHLLEQHDRKADLAAPYVRPVNANPQAGTRLSGRASQLLAKIQNFEGIISGSQLGISLGDAINIKVGDSYEYADGSFDVKIGTGGHTHEETRGDSTKESYTYGTTKEKSFNYKDQDEEKTCMGVEKTREFHMGSAVDGFTFFGGAKTETEFQGGAFNKQSLSLAVNNENSVFVGLEGKLDLLLAGKAEISIGAAALLKVEICAAASLHVEIAAKSEFKTTNFSAILSADKVALKDLEANLKKVDADILRDKVAIKDTEAAISKMKSTINENTAALQKSMASLRNATTALQIDNTALTQQFLSASRTMTSGITMIQ
jgi:type VI secretion system VgrG family protein